MNYPGHLVKLGESNTRIVVALKNQLNEELPLVGSGQVLDITNSTFDRLTQQAVKLFQARHVDSRGVSLKQDGVVGPLTWVALFGTQSLVTMEVSSDALLSSVIEVADGEESKHVRESPPKSNSGPEVNNYLASTMTPPGNYWCCAFVFWCFREASKKLGRPNPMVQTASCMDHWIRCAGKGARRILGRQAVQNPALIRPGMVFIIDHGGGFGHTGLIRAVSNGVLETIEGNTDASLNRNGDGVYRLNRKVNEINKGFIDYSAVLV